MYIFNISFVIPSRRKDGFVRWAKESGAAAAASPAVKGYKVLMVAAVPGDPDFTKQSDRNISVQIAFGSLSDCRRWNEERFGAFLDEYAKWHGPNPAFFATILKEL